MRIYATIAAFLLLSLTACSPAADEEPSPQPEPTLDQAALDAAVEATVSAELTRIAIENPSATPVEIQPTATPDASEPAASPTQTSQPSPTISATALDDQALFLADVTIPDGTEIVGGEPFTKTWRFQNIGLNTWTEDYSFVFVNGELMDGFPIFLEEEVSPGETVDISITMIAPLEGGTYEGFWMFANEDGEIFGTGELANQAVVVSIVVIEPTPVPSATPTSAPSPTPTP